MKKLTLKFIVALFAVSIIFFSCEKEEEDDSASIECADNVEKLSKIVIQKSQTYATNPTVANCNAMKQAVLNQMNAAESCVRQYGGSSAEITALKQQYNSLSCK